MIKLYVPQNEVQLAILKSIFEAEGIAIFVLNDNFGSMEPGIQIALLNQKTIMVREEDYANARAVIENFLGKIVEDEETQPSPTINYSFFDKLRMVIEGLFFGWVMPGRSRRKGKEDRKEDR